MNRGSFIKSLATLFAAPNILGEINFEKMVSNNVATTLPGATRTILSDLQLLTPDFYKQMVERYGSESYEIMLQFLQNPNQ